MTKILFCGYRHWALWVCAELELVLPDVCIDLVTTPEDLLKACPPDSDVQYDIVFVIGWSWMVPDHVLNGAVVVGMHPSDLPRYAGGSPIQHQIIDGLVESKATLFRLTPKMDAGPIVSKRSFSLQGHLDEVFNDLAKATLRLLLDFVKSWPNFEEHEQEHTHGFVRRRLRPASSHLTKEALSGMTCLQLWNSIRCREDPYPNVFLEDETGRLVIKQVEFEPK